MARLNRKSTRLFHVKHPYRRLYLPVIGLLCLFSLMTAPGVCLADATSHSVMGAQAAPAANSSSFGWGVGIIIAVLLGIIVYLISVLLKRRQAEQRLLESKERYRALFEGIPIGLFSFSPSGVIDNANDALAHILGYPTSGALEGKNLGEINLKLDDIIAEMKKPQNMLKYSGAISGYELQLRRTDGRFIWTEISCHVRKDPDGQARYYEGSIVDITERRKAESSMRQYHDHLEVIVENRTLELQVANEKLKKEIAERQHIQTQLSYANKELERIAHADGLTKVANRRRFDDHLVAEWQRLIRDQSPLSLILCDVDFFKRYNDTYGHQAGDDCLCAIAQTLASCANRPTDMVARYGGEEFAIILANTDKAGATKVAENIRTKVADMKIEHSASEIASFVTISLGVCTAYPFNGASPDFLVAHADKALYEAKENGRNRSTSLDLPEGTN